MKTLFTTDYKNYDPSWPRSSRPSARAIILIDNISDYSTLAPHDKIALAYAKNLGYYKFPGGGIHEGEEKTAALIREVAEETVEEVAEAVAPVADAVEEAVAPVADVAVLTRTSGSA